MDGKPLSPEILDLIGDPDQIAISLAKYTKSAKALSANFDAIAKAYPDQWIVFYDEEVQASGQTSESAMANARECGIPLTHAIVRCTRIDDHTWIHQRMLRGWFDSSRGRPFLDAHIVLPSQKLFGTVSFLIDTGSDRTVLMPLDADQIGYDYDVTTF